MHLLVEGSGCKLSPQCLESRSKALAAAGFVLAFFSQDGLCRMSPQCCAPETPPREVWTGVKPLKWDTEQRQLDAWSSYGAKDINVLVNSISGKAANSDSDSMLGHVMECVPNISAWVFAFVESSDVESPFGFSSLGCPAFWLLKEEQDQHYRRDNVLQHMAVSAPW